MGKPFSDLEKQAFAILANGGDPAQSLNTELARYWRWRINPSLDSHDLDPESIRAENRKLDDFAIEPFGLDLPNGVSAKVTVSKRTQARVPEGSRATFGFKAINATNVAIKLANFRPAKVYWRTGALDQSVERTSRITGRKYKTYYRENAEGFSMPFGEGAENETLQQRQEILRGWLQANQDDPELISFSPEKGVG